MRGAIRRFIEISTPYKVCGEAGDRVAAIDKASEFSCDLILLDLGMPMLNGVETASVLRRMVPGTKIIGLAMFAGEVRRSLVTASGFDMVLSKHDGLAQLSEAIRALLPAPD